MVAGGSSLRSERLEPLDLFVKLCDGSPISANVLSMYRLPL